MTKNKKGLTIAQTTLVAGFISFFAGLYMILTQEMGTIQYDISSELIGAGVIVVIASIIYIFFGRKNKKKK